MGDVLKVKYLGPNIGVTMLTNDKIYEVLGIECGMLRIRDDDPDDETGYLYDLINPGTIDGKITGKFIIIEDDEKGTLGKIINDEGK